MDSVNGVDRIRAADSISALIESGGCPSLRLLRLPSRRQLHDRPRLRRRRQHLRQPPHPLPLPRVHHRLQRDLQRLVWINRVQMRPTLPRFSLVFPLIPPLSPA